MPPDDPPESTARIAQCIVLRDEDEPLADPARQAKIEAGISAVKKLPKNRPVSIRDFVIAVLDAQE